MRRKEKQNQQRDNNMQEWQYVQSLLDKIESIGTAGISSDEKDAINQLKDKLAEMQKEQEYMKDVNKFYRTHGTCSGFEGMNTETAVKLDLSVKNGYSWEKQPFAPYHLSNNSQNMNRIKKRIESLEKVGKIDPSKGWKFDGGEVVLNKEENRIQLVYDGKPDEETRSNLKKNGFRWAPSQKAWQRMLNNHGIYAAKKVTGRLENSRNDIAR